jgi:hypothetical protein
MNEWMDRSSRQFLSLHGLSGISSRVYLPCRVESDEYAVDREACCIRTPETLQKKKKECMQGEGKMKKRKRSESQAMTETSTREKREHCQLGRGCVHEKENGNCDRQNQH